MSAIFFSVVLALIFLCSSALVKSAGFLVKKSKISWKHSCIFVAMLFACTTVLGILRKISPVEIPFTVNVAASVCLEALLASIYFEKRAVDKNGVAVGRRRAAIIGGVVFSLGTVLACVLLMLKTVFQIP